MDTPGLDVQDIIKEPFRAKTYAFITPNVPEPFVEGNNQPQDRPLNPFLSEPRQKITTKQQWRSPLTWQVSVAELETILERYNTPLNFISSIPKDIRDNLKKNHDPIDI